MIRFAAIVTILLWPSWAMAKPLPVLSGEHADFSRIVILFGSVPDWRFGRVAGGFELRPDDPEAEYDFTKVFELIPRSRIASVQTRSEGRVFLEVTCDCHGDAFEIRNGLVIDIKTGRPPAGSAFQAVLPDFGDTKPDAAVLPAGGRAPVPRPLPPPDENKSADAPARSPSQVFAAGWYDRVAPPRPIAAKPEPESPPPDPTAELRAALVEQIGRAASQGLVSPAVPDPIAAPVDVRPIAPEIPVAETAEPAEHTNPALDTIPDRSNFRIETAYDIALADRPNVRLTNSGETCLPTGIFDVAGWGVPPDRGSELADYRDKLIGEFDESDPASLLALAKYYLYLTFGAEARSLIELYRGEIPDAGIYLALAAIMDDGQFGGTNRLSEQIACATRGALWAVLARPAPGAGADVHANTVIEAFVELPLHLRRHIGPRLAQRFLDSGDTETATVIRDAIARAAGNHGEGFKLMNAELAIAAGDVAAGTDQLRDIAHDDGPMAPEAIVRLIDTALQATQEIPKEIIDLAAALSFEHRGTRLGAELTRAHLAATARSGAIALAQAGLDAANRRGDLDAAGVLAIRREILGMAATVPDDVEFLKAVGPGRVALGDQPEDDAVRQVLAARLLDMGLPDPARLILDQDTAPPTAADRRLYARSFLAERRLDLAKGYLAGLDDPESLRLRAELLGLSGDYAAAGRLYDLMGDDTGRARTAWRGKNWEAVQTLGTPVEQAAAGLTAASQGDTGEPDAAGGTLARDRALLARSEASRQVLSTLLAQAGSLQP